MTRRRAALEYLDRNHAPAAARTGMRSDWRLVGIDGISIMVLMFLRHGHADELAGARNVVGAGGSGEQAVVADAVKAFGQDVDQEAADVSYWPAFQHDS